MKPIDWFKVITLKINGIIVEVNTLFITLQAKDLIITLQNDDKNLINHLFIKVQRTT